MDYEYGSLNNFFSGTLVGEISSVVGISSDQLNVVKIYPERTLADTVDTNLNTGLPFRTSNFMLDLLLYFPSSLDAMDVVDDLNSISNYFINARINHVAEIATTPNDPNFEKQKGFWP
ncbi:MAG: hypothetical protein KDC92_06725, partial [Bacteroidetes bacterium]|nr:hypothetical protein [Bacteroidota bacterium]